MKLESEIGMAHSWIRKLNLSGLKWLVALPIIICRSKNLVELNVSGCSKLESLTEEIGDSENLEKLDASHILISRPPPSIIRLNKLKFLSFAKGRLYDLRKCFVFPPVAEGLRSLEELNLSRCNLTDGGSLEDIGCLSSLKTLVLSYCNIRDGELLKDIGHLSSLNKLFLKGNKFEHLLGSIDQLGALQCLDLSDCERLTQLPELPPKLEELCVNCDMALKSIASLATKSNIRQIICRLLRERNYVYRRFKNNLGRIPSWFHHQEGSVKRVSINLPENWYECDSFLGVAVCFSGKSVGITIQLIPLCNDGMITEVTLCNNFSEFDTVYCSHFFMLPVAGLRDTCEANGKSPNDYGFIRVSSSLWTGFGYRLLYKDELEPEALLQMKGNNERKRKNQENT